MNFIQESFFLRLEQAPIKVAMMSRKNCHQTGLDSIVVDQKPDGRLVRAFFAHKEHQMYKNDNLSTLSLGVHNHQYNLELTALYGEAYNIEFEDYTDGELCEHNINKYEYTSTLSGSGGAGPVHTTSHNLSMVGGSRISNLKLYHSDLHTVWVPEGCKAAWIVEEGTKVKNTTTLYSPQNRCRINSVEGKYERFNSKQEILDMVYKFLRGWISYD